MKVKKHFSILIGISLMLVFGIIMMIMTEANRVEFQTSSKGNIFLYGEMHGEEKILERKFELWYEYYHDEGMRHLFVEKAYFTAEFLNLWMQADNDDILKEIYEDWTGTMAQSPHVLNFYRNIKEHCPETIFHGTDIGHNRQRTGQRFLKFLKENNLEDSEQYVLTKEAIEQGDKYYRTMDDVYRENMMVKNFIREFDKLDGESTMGSYGASHTGMDTILRYDNDSVPSMAKQLKALYGKNVYSEDLSYLAMMMEPERIDFLEVLGKSYKAEYYGKHATPGLVRYTHREFWRLKDAYEDFYHYPLNGNGIPYHEYPMLIKTGEVYVIDYTLNNGEIMRQYLRADGDQWRGMEVTVEFDI